MYFSNFDIVLFDFDDTLAIHKSHKINDEIHKEWFKRVLESGIEVWNENCEKNEQMQEFIEICKEHNKRMGLLSCANHYKIMEGRQHWVKHHYGVELENFCVGSMDKKVEAMIGISDAYNIPRIRILLIDDNYEHLNDAESNGFMAYSPMEIVNYINNLN